MSERQRIFDLLESMLDSGSTPEQVYADCPGLLPMVREQWVRIRALESGLDLLFPSPKPVEEADENQQLRLWQGRPQIPGYEIGEILGRGGVGVVYQARHLKLNRPVAIKMLLSGLYASETEQKRFLREAESIASVRHENLVRVYDVGDAQGCLYFTMELIDGGTLAHELGGMPLHPAKAAVFLKAVAEAIEVAHSMGIVHRDLKPSNILLTEDGTPKISDFGLARRYEEQPDITRSGDRIGTPSYMAPEQAAGRHNEVGPLADLYSLGAILYEMLTGRPPFRADTAADTQQQLLGEEPARPSRLNTKIPRDLETICLKCLQKDPSRRYSSATALAEDLGRFLDDEPIKARPVGAIERAMKWTRRHPSQAALMIAGVLLAVLMIGGAGWLISVRSSRTQIVSADLRRAVELEQNGQWEHRHNPHVLRSVSNYDIAPGKLLRQRRINNQTRRCLCGERNDRGGIESRCCRESGCNLMMSRSTCFIHGGFQQ
jgi:serine/threonine-protein kinase